MDDIFYDYTTGELCVVTSDTTALTPDGDVLLKTGDGLAVNLTTGQLDSVSGWSDDSPDGDLF